MTFNLPQKGQVIATLSDCCRGLEFIFQPASERTGDCDVERGLHREGGSRLNEAHATTSFAKQPFYSLFSTTDRSALPWLGVVR